ncbi:DUF2971 domain-containing protein [uncultured Stenotrophomonas sp.]|uniref:DUF2971 domain-containing protein n=1 Tax=uncultured Stenotrophomonas sp. TaxID=165438 RepID=UPI0025F56861|nr:DUF2971 domain-containing protein [uncultured Stenotrophomonas sp.]
MIRELNYQPEPGDLLYHYCSPATFLAILQGKKLRFSDVLCMNDSSEYAWGTQALIEGLKRNGSPLAAEIALGLQGSYDLAHRISITTACCLSTDGDVLSQWRAYAENGSGFSIGFDPHQLDSMPVRSTRVLYKDLEQQSLIDKLLKEVPEFCEGAVANPADCPERVVELLLEMIGFKNPAFEEEKEVRLVHRIAVDSDPFRTFYASETGSSDVSVGFQMRGSNPSAYLDLPLPEQDPGIRRIVVGPRAQVELRSLRILLGATGFGDVSVDRSQATYR